MLSWRAVCSYWNIIYEACATSTIWWDLARSAAHGMYGPGFTRRWSSACGLAGTARSSVWLYFTELTIWHSYRPSRVNFEPNQSKFFSEPFLTKNRLHGDHIENTWKFKFGPKLLSCSSRDLRVSIFSQIRASFLGAFFNERPLAWQQYWKETKN